MTTPTTTIATEPARTRALLVLALAATAALAAGPAAAQDLSAISNVFTTVSDALSGPIGQALAVIAVIVAGIALIALGRFNPGYLAALIVGVVLIFSADDIVAGFGSP